jgi:hypothetical protein
MSQLKDIIETQVDNLENITKGLKEIIKYIENNKTEVYNLDTLQSIEKINSNINKIESNFEIIQHNFDLALIEKKNKNLERIKNYKIDKQVLKTFTPYMIYLRLILENNYNN